MRAAGHISINHITRLHTMSHENVIKLELELKVKVNFKLKLNIFVSTPIFEGLEIISLTPVKSRTRKKFIAKKCAFSGSNMEVYRAKIAENELKNRRLHE